MTLSKLLQTVHAAATVKQVEHEGFGNGDGTYTNVPYQILLHLYSGPKERNELKRLAYAGVTAQGTIKNPYSLQFAKMFDNYIAALNKLLRHMHGELLIQQRNTLSGAIFYHLD